MSARPRVDPGQASDASRSIVFLRVGSPLSRRDAGAVNAFLRPDPGDIPSAR